MCRTEGSSDPFVIPELMFRTGQQFTYGVCLQCGTVVTSDMNQASDLAYPENYYSISMDPARELSGVHHKIVLTTLSWLTALKLRRLISALRLVTPIKEVRTVMRSLEALAVAIPRARRIRVLDVGSGSGFLPYILNHCGRFDALGIDPYAPEQLASGSSFLKKSSIEEIGADERFDLICFHHSLEHMPDPIGAVTKAREMLTSAGRILVRVPTVSCEAFDEYGSFFYGLDAPRHLFIPSRAGLDAFGGQLGLRTEARFDDSSSTQFYLSEIAMDGGSTMDPATNLQSFRKPPGSPLQKFRLGSRAFRLNRVHRGDQVCYVFAKAN